MEDTQMRLFDPESMEEPPQEQFPAAFLARPKKPAILKKLHIEALKGIENVTINLRPLQKG
jgi:hypothetical protein